LEACVVSRASDPVAIALGSAFLASRWGGTNKHPESLCNGIQKVSQFRIHLRSFVVPAFSIFEITPDSENESLAKLP